MDEFDQRDCDLYFENKREDDDEFEEEDSPYVAADLELDEIEDDLDEDEDLQEAC